ncbi:hypothetical protein P43SY_007336 [Pythium insidiosum]|uniref:Transmembrane protein n=1 Tax=Pythium insidiosum TaxID=114742 RepID=A0AAD5QD05_PYTIN|nr:hypothetical protein P43SY_007336 [Pythium insidiosum]
MSATTATGARSDTEAQLEALELGIELGILPFQRHEQHGFVPLTSARLRQELPQRDQGTATISFWYPRSRDGDNSRSSGVRDDIESGALYAGPILDLFKRRRIGLLLNYAALGYVDGMLPMTLRTLYSALDAARFDAFLMIVSLCRVFAALCSDLAPTRKYRRRPFFIVGWAIVLAVFAVLTGVEGDGATPTRSDVAASSHWIYLLALVPIGHVLAAATSDGLLVEYAQREGEDERGCIQMLLVATRIVGTLLGRSTVPIRTADCDDRGHGSACPGSFAVVFALGAFVALTALLSSVWAVDVPYRLVVATTHNPLIKDVPRIRDVGRFASSRVLWQFAAFTTIQAATFAWMAPSPHELATHVLGLGDMTRWISDGAMLSSQLVCAVLVLASRRVLRWRVVTAASVVLGSLVASLVGTVLLLQGSTTSLAVFLTSHHVGVVFTTIARLVSLLAVVELARPGIEATSYAILTVLGEVGAELGVAVADKARSSWSQPLGKSSNDFAVALAVVLLVARVVVNLVLLPLLPPSKAALRGLRDRLRRDPQPPSCASTVVGRVVLLVLSVAWVGAIARNVMHLVTPRDGDGVVSTVMSVAYLY